MNKDKIREIRDSDDFSCARITRLCEALLEDGVIDEVMPAPNVVEIVSPKQLKPHRETLYEDVDADMRDIYWADDMDAWLRDEVLPVLERAMGHTDCQDCKVEIDALIKELRNET